MPRTGKLIIYTTKISEIEKLHHEQTDDHIAKQNQNHNTAMISWNGQPIFNLKKSWNFQKSKFNFFGLEPGTSSMQYQAFEPLYQMAMQENENWTIYSTKSKKTEYPPNV